VTAALRARHRPAPSVPWAQQLEAAGLPPDSRVVTESQFEGLVEAAAAGLGLAELRQAALEVRTEGGLGAHSIASWSPAAGGHVGMRVDAHVQGGLQQGGCAPRPRPQGA
jgi:hypothetical protein